jgi:hypothetical protein
VTVSIVNKRGGRRECANLREAKSKDYVKVTEREPEVSYGACASLKPLYDLSEVAVHTCWLKSDIAVSFEVADGQGYVFVFDVTADASFLVSDARRLNNLLRVIADCKLYVEIPTKCRAVVIFFEAVNDVTLFETCVFAPAAVMSSSIGHDYVIICSNDDRLGAADASCQLRRGCAGVQQYGYGQTPLYEQVGNLLANKFVSGAPDTNLLYNLLADKLH